MVSILNILKTVIGTGTTVTSTSKFRQNWTLLKYLNYFRLIIAVSTCTIALTTTKLPMIGQSNPRLFLIVGLIYAFLSGFSLTTIHYRKPLFDQQLSILAFADVVGITLLLHASGGITSGLGILLLISISGSSMMMAQRMTILFASLAVIGILIEHSWVLLEQFSVAVEGGKITMSEHTLRGYPQTGLLGLALFATAYLANNFAARLRATEAHAEQLGADVANLEHINALVIQRIEAGLIVCDPIGHIHMINAPARKFVGIEYEPSRSTMLTEVSNQLAGLLFAWLDKTGNQLPNAIRLPTNYIVLPKLYPLGDSEDSGILIFLEDVALQKQQAQQEKMAALARLTAGIAHEIRNPLGAVRNAAQLLGESAARNPEDTRLVEIINNHSVRMNHIIENISELGRRDRARPQNLDLQNWIKEFVKHLLNTVDLPAEAINLKLTPGLQVSMDPDQLYQVVNNLCQNAIRHSPDYNNGAVVQIETGMDKNNNPYLEVTDWGEGVPPEIRDHIFEPFYTTADKGTGLGLYIARELCEANNGYIRYRPGEQDKGSCFCITLAHDKGIHQAGVA